MKDSKEEVPELEDTTLIERINKKDMEPLYDNDHEHIFVRDLEDTDDYYAEMCTLCPVGRLIAKN